jgi:hypothetical protein
MNMNESELGHLARHLGHDAKTHKEFYRLSHSTVQLSKVSIMKMCHIFSLTVACNRCIYEVVSRCSGQSLIHHFSGSELSFLSHRYTVLMRDVYSLVTRGLSTSTC